MQKIPNTSCHQRPVLDVARRISIVLVVITRPPFMFAATCLRPHGRTKPLLLFFVLLSPRQEVLEGATLLGSSPISRGARGRAGPVLDGVELLRGQPISIPARHFCRQVDLFPLGMK